MIIGITGSIGAGKTTIAKLFSRHGYERIDADEIAHGLLKKNSASYKKIIKEFGSEILDKSNNIDREKFGEIVFNDDAKLKKLNSITHPIIINEIKKEIKKIRQKNKNAKIAVDAPLLFEANAEDIVDKIIVIKTSNNSVISRNRKFTKGQIENILKHQMPLEEKMKYADFMIENDRNFKHMEKQVIEIIKNLEQK